MAFFNSTRKSNFVCFLIEAGLKNKNKVFLGILIKKFFFFGGGDKICNILRDYRNKYTRERAQTIRNPGCMYQMQLDTG